MRYLLLTVCLVGCTTVDRPDLPAPKGYEMKQDRLFGVVPMQPKAVPKQTQAQKTQGILRKPAVVTLSVALPIALLAFAASIVMQNPSLTKKLASVALIAFLTAFGAAVWILVTMWLIPLAVVAVLIGYLIYRKFHGKGFKWHAKEADDE